MLGKEKKSNSKSRIVSEEFMKDVQLVADLLLIPYKKIKNVDVDGDGNIDGYRFDLGNPLYTAQPMSAIKDLIIVVNGENVDSNKISFILRKNKISLKNVTTINELWWSYGGLITVFVEKTGGLPPRKLELQCSLIITPAFYGFYPENTILSTKTNMIIE